MNELYGVEAGRVVVGVSGSEASLAALAIAADEATLRGAALHVITVYASDSSSRAPYASPEPVGAPPDIADGEVARRAVAAIPGDLAVMHEHIVGRAPAVLIMASEGAELLILGRTAHNSYLGPTARACVAHARCPVTVVNPEWLRERETALSHVGRGS